MPRDPHGSCIARPDISIMTLTKPPSACFSGVIFLIYGPLDKHMHLLIMVQTLTRGADDCKPIATPPCTTSHGKST